MAATGTPWIRVYALLLKNRKIKRLAKTLKLTMRDTRGLVVSLWLEALDSEPDGDLSDCTDEEIAGWCRWRGDVLRLMNGLRKAQLLDGEPGHRAIHNWDEYMGSYKRAKIQRKYRRKKLDENPVTPQGGNSGVTVDPIEQEERILKQQQQEAEATTQPQGPDQVRDAAGVGSVLAPPPVPAEQPLATQPVPAACESSSAGSIGQLAHEHTPGPSSPATDGLGGLSRKPEDGMQSRDEYNAWWLDRGFGSSGEKTQGKLEKLLPISHGELEDALRALNSEGRSPNGGLALYRIGSAREKKRALENSPVKQNRPTNSATDEDIRRDEQNKRDMEDIDPEKNIRNINKLRKHLEMTCSM